MTPSCQDHNITDELEVQGKRNSTISKISKESETERAALPKQFLQVNPRVKRNLTYNTDFSQANIQNGDQNNQDDQNELVSPCFKIKNETVGRSNTGQ